MIEQDRDYGAPAVASGSGICWIIEGAVVVFGGTVGLVGLSWCEVSSKGEELVL